MIPISSNGNKLRWEVWSIDSSEKEEKFGKKVSIGDIDWNIGAFFGHSAWGNSYLSINLYCDAKNKKPNWMCEVDATIRLMNQSGDGPEIQNELKGFYYQEQKKCGIERFTAADKLKGCYQYRAIIVEMDLNFKFYDFSKTIPNFTDITVHVEDTEFYLNKWVLSSESQYFYDLFVDKKIEDIRIKLDDVKAPHFCFMLGSFHPGFSLSSGDNYNELVKVAKKFGVPSFDHALEQFFISSTKLSACEKMRIADENGYEHLLTTFIESLNGPGAIRSLRADVKFAGLKEATELRIMYRLLDFF